MNKLVIPALNLIVVILVLIVNFLASAGYVNGANIAEISRKYEGLLTPAGYAFSIWGVIYLGQVFFVAFQWVQLYTKSPLRVNTGIWLVVLNFGNISWLFFWLNEWIGTSVLTMAVMLISLLRLVWKLNMEIYDASLRILVFVWWPICIYLGWIMLALGANLNIYFESLDLEWWNNWETAFAILKVSLLTAGYLALVYFRNMRETALVGIWGFLALAYKNWPDHIVIVCVTVLMAAILLIAVMIHGYQNRYYSPLNKWKRGEW
jgi:hypothetical protein